MELIIFAVLCYGISNILVHSSIFSGLRFVLDKYSPSFLGKLINCMMCTSFWVGIFVSLFIPSPLTFYLSNVVLNSFIYWLFTGSLASGLVWLIHTVQEWFETK